ncbi:MAG: restriction endonuclease, partial [Blastocatellia bacterium]|nr:restriction endonuclease [Blastocatellia bacterium]
SLQPDEAGQMPLVAADFKRWISDALAKRQELESIPDNDITDVETKTRLFAEAETALDNIRFIADLLVGESLRSIGRLRADMAAELMSLSDDISHALDLADAERDLRVMALRQKAERILKGRRLFHWALEFPEVFAAERGGFDGLVGNPPFQGGKLITGTLGTDYREFLVEHLANSKRGNADLCAYFFLRAQSLLKSGGNFGLIATNTIAQGDTREVGLDQLATNGATIFRAVPSVPWPGTAALEVAKIWLRSGNHWQGEIVLDEKPVGGITPFLTVPSKALGNPYRLKANENKSFIGSIVLGMGFILPPEEAQKLIAKNPRNKDVLFPYLNGEDLNSRLDQSPSRWVINFYDWPLDAQHDGREKPKGPPYAVDYPDCLTIVEEKVKPERDKLGLKSDSSAKGYARLWWQFARKGLDLYTTIAGMEQVLVCPIVTKHLSFVFSSSEQVFMHKLTVFALTAYGGFSLLQSSFHDLWSREYSSTLETRLNYSPSDCFETFPFPLSTEGLDDIGERYYTHRQAIMTERQEGLTKTYNRFHNPQEFAPDIAELRRLHVEMDGAVARAYGWADLELGHGFHQTKQGMRYTISETARREVLDRLLELNHERYAQEVAQGLHEKGKKKPAGAKVASKGKAVQNVQQLSMFEE